MQHFKVALGMHESKERPPSLETGSKQHSLVQYFSLCMLAIDPLCKLHVAGDPHLVFV